MIDSDFINNMSIYFCDNSELQLSDHDSAYFQDLINKSLISNEIRVLSVNRGKYGTNYSSPYLIIALSSEGYLKYLNNIFNKLCNIQDTEITRLNNLIYGIMIKYVRVDTNKKSKDKYTRIWLNKIFKLLNKNYHLKVKMLRTW